MNRNKEEISRCITGYSEILSWVKNVGAELYAREPASRRGISGIGVDEKTGIVVYYDDARKRSLYLPWDFVLRDEEEERINRDEYCSLRVCEGDKIESLGGTMEVAIAVHLENSIFLSEYDSMNFNTYYGDEIFVHTDKDEIYKYLCNAQGCENVLQESYWGEIYDKASRIYKRKYEGGLFRASDYRTDVVVRRYRNYSVVCSFCHKQFYRDCGYPRLGLNNPEVTSFMSAKTMPMANLSTIISLDKERNKESISNRGEQ